MSGARDPHGALPPPDEQAAPATMPFRAHLVELRGRLLRATIAIALGFFVAWTIHVELYEWLSGPVRSAMADNGLFAIKALQITESISVYVKLSLVGGVFLASPYVFYQVWAFVAPGLVASERRIMVPVVGASVTFFAAGAAFCYAVVLPFMTDFLIKLTVEAQGMTLEPTLQSTVAYSMWLLLAFGLVFELPVFMYFLSALGLVTARGLLAFYRYWVVIAFVVGAILTPTPDPLNQMLMSGPLVILYGLGTIVAWLVERDRSSESGLPIRGAAVLLVLLVAAGWYASETLTGVRHRQPIEDVPREVTQLVGIHRGSIPRLRQQATGAHSKSALGVLELYDQLGAGELAGTTVWLARFPDGVALIARHDKADTIPPQVAAKRRVSQVTYAGGPSALFTFKGDRRHWRVAAPQPNVLWLGNDAALARLAQVREGSAPALVEDIRVAELLEPLRASGPLFALTLSQGGRVGWLPQGALADTVELVTASLEKGGKQLVVTYRCRGADNARSLRDRLQVWTAEVRDESGQKPVGSARMQQVSDRLAKLATSMARLADATARLLPDGSPDQVASLKASHDSMLIARELRGHVPDKPRSKGPLANLVLPPSVVDAHADLADVRWRAETATATLIDALFAPSRAGFDVSLLPARKPGAGAPGDAKGQPGAGPSEAKGADKAGARGKGAAKGAKGKKHTTGAPKATKPKGPEPHGAEAARLRKEAEAKAELGTLMQRARGPADAPP